MTIIVESGAGMADAESFASVEFATDYHRKRGNEAWEDLETAEKEAALRRATDFMLQAYGSKWAGSRVSALQTLDWPRVGAYLGAFEIGSALVPILVQRACAALALRAAAGALTADPSPIVKKKKVGPLEIEYADSPTVAAPHPEVDAMLAPLFKARGMQIGLVRA